MSEFLGILHHLQLKYPGKRMPMHCHWWKTLDDLKEIAGMQSLPNDSESDSGESIQRAPQSPTAVTRRGIASARDWSEDEEEPEPEIEIEVEVQVQVRAQGRHGARPRARSSTVRRPSRQRRAVQRQSHAQTAVSSSKSEDTSSSSDDGIDHDGGSDSDCSYRPLTARHVERSHDDDSPVTSAEDEASDINSEGHASQSDGIIDLIDTSDENEDAQVYEPVLDLTTPPQTVPGPGVARHKRLCTTDKR